MPADGAYVDGADGAYVDGTDLGIILGIIPGGGGGGLDIATPISMHVVN